MARQGYTCTRASFWSKIVGGFQILLGFTTMAMFSMTLSEVIIRDADIAAMSTTVAPSSGGYSGSSTEGSKLSSKWTERAALMIGIVRSSGGMLAGVMLLIGAITKNSIMLTIWKYLAGLSLIVAIMVMMTDVAKHASRQRVALNIIDIVFLSVGIWTIQLFKWDLEDDQNMRGTKK